jgi:PII-like signaling protein
VSAAAAAGPAQPDVSEAVKLTSYFGERQRAGGRFAADALLDLYEREHVAASVLLRGAEGYGAGHPPRGGLSLTLSEDLPLISVAVDSRARIEPLAGPTARLCGPGLVTLERARLIRGVVPGPRAAGERRPPQDHWPPEDRYGADEEARLTVYLGRHERVHRVPAFMAVCDLLYRRGLAGATALLGVDGTAHGERQRAVFFSRNAQTPMMVVAVGSWARLAPVLPQLTGLLRRPLLTLERVQVLKRDGELLSEPAAPGPAAGAGAGEAGLPVWRKLTVYTSETALHEGQPVHREIVRRLRAAGIAGATTQHGVWGFHGRRPPHGDRLLQLGRQVPAVTSVIDEPGRTAAAFAVIDELTRTRGLVTSELVPVVRAGREAAG